MAFRLTLLLIKMSLIVGGLPGSTGVAI